MWYKFLFLSPEGDGGAAGGEGVDAGGDNGKPADDKGGDKGGDEKGDKGKESPPPKEDAETLKAKNFYKNMNTRYNSDPEFRKAFDKIVAPAKKGGDDSDGDDQDFGEDGDAGDKKSQKGKPKGDTVTVAELRQQLKETNEKLAKVAGQQEQDFVGRSRSDINTAYVTGFGKLADDVGYAKGSAEYAMVLKNTISIAKDLAGDYDLKRENGEPDLLIKYDNKLLEAAFKKADKEMRDLGIDPVERRDKFLADKDEKERSKKEREIDDVLKKENLDTPEKRAKALEKTFNIRLRQLGVKRQRL